MLRFGPPRSSFFLIRPFTQHGTGKGKKFQFVTLRRRSSQSRHLPFGGTCGVFFQCVRAEVDSPIPVQWISPLLQEKPCVYLSRVRQLALDKKQGIEF